MFRIIKAIAGLALAAIMVVLVLALRKPADFRIERSILIKAPPDAIFPLVNDFHRWTLWSPFEKMDPNMNRTYCSAPQGTGAVYEWKGNGRTGAGRMEIVGETAPAKITVKLDFLKPMKARNTAEFTFAPTGDMTNVTWAMYGPSPFVAKIFHVFMDMDAMVGKSFDEGLTRLKETAEKK
jgi:hypothetical protein